MKSLISSHVTVVLISFLVFLNQGCTHSPQKKSVAPEISLPDNHRMHFRGKGAGAGMMLSSSMGPMGIAIGVAIDEGIAKSIGETAAAGGVDIQSIVVEAFASVAEPFDQPLKIRVLKYGFVTVSADEHYSDPVVAELELAIESVDGMAEVVNVYKDVSAGECDVWKSELSAVKTDAAVIGEAFRRAAGCGVVLLSSSGGASDMNAAE